MFTLVYKSKSPSCERFNFLQRHHKKAGNKTSSSVKFIKGNAGGEIALKQRLMKMKDFISRT
jgi:hypothetical protein